MKIETGLFSHMVMQREGSACRQQITGISEAKNTALRAIVNGKEQHLGKTSEDGHFCVELTGIPVGGPYSITLRAGSDSITADDVLVGDVWILAGQSNMQGIGNLDRKNEPHPMVRCYFMNDEWGVAQDPLHHLTIANARVHWSLMNIRKEEYDPASQPPPVKGVGPGIPFGKYLHQKTGVPIGLISCAHGGTTMDQWDPAKKDLGDDSLYGASILRVKRNGGKAAGLFWYQGCSDVSQGKEAVNQYIAKNLTLFQSFRRDVNDNDMPIVLVQIARFLPLDFDDYLTMNWAKIRELERQLAKLVPNLTVVPTIDLDMEDEIHLNSDSHRILGRRAAEAALTLMKCPFALPPPIELDNIELDQNSGSDRRIILSFKNVCGSLTSHGSRPMGFSGFYSADRKCCTSFIKAELDGNRVYLYGRELVNFVAYGYELDCFCNVTDEAGRSLPAFGPLRITQPATTGFTQKTQVSDPIRCHDTFDALVYPEGVVFKETPNEQFFVIPQDMKEVQGLEHIRYFRTSYRFANDLDAALGLGYDGPVRVFVDKQIVFEDPNGTNPIVPLKRIVPFRFTKGDHEIVMAMRGRKGNSWGISLQLIEPDRLIGPEDEDTGLSAAVEEI